MHRGRKGKRGEYAGRDLIRSFGFDARRGLASAGEPDLVHSIPGVHVEVKNNEALSIWAMIAQAERDAEGKEPVILFKRNGTKMYAATDAKEYLRLKRMQGITLEFIDVLRHPDAEETEESLREIVDQYVRLIEATP